MVSWNWLYVRTSCARISSDLVASLLTDTAYRGLNSAARHKKREQSTACATCVHSQQHHTPNTLVCDPQTLYGTRVIPYHVSHFRRILCCTHREYALLHI